MDEWPTTQVSLPLKHAQKASDPDLLLRTKKQPKAPNRDATIEEYFLTSIHPYSKVRTDWNADQK